MQQSQLALPVPFVGPMYAEIPFQSHRMIGLPVPDLTAPVAICAGLSREFTATQLPASFPEDWLAPPGGKMRPHEATFGEQYHVNRIKKVRRLLVLVCICRNRSALTHPTITTIYVRVSQ